MKKRLVIFFFFVFFTVVVYSQAYHVNSVTNVVSNYSTILEFDSYCQYDYDVKKYYNCSLVSSTVAINVGENGEGSLSVFVASKVKFRITNTVIKWNDFISFTLVNNYGRKLYAKLNLSNNTIISFEFQNPEDNTGFVLGNQP